MVPLLVAYSDNPALTGGGSYGCNSYNGRDSWKLPAGLLSSDHHQTGLRAAFWLMVI
jgi:hypothetical protein